MSVLETVTQSKVIRYGHTPDPDDAYMFYGFATDQVKIRDFKIDHVLEDIETLNQRAVNSEIEVTAISAAIYPQLEQKYWILPIGASVGRNYGPIIAHLNGPAPKGKKIGVPGFNTTAHLLMKLYTEGYEPIPFRFDEIPQALKDKKVDYGVLIHEAQLTFADYGLTKILDLGEEWMKDTDLPIPLGLDVVHKDLGRELALQISDSLKKSIVVANQQREKAVEYALKFGRGLQKDLTDKFVGMYVNEDTLEIGDEGEKALNLLFDKAYRAGYYKTPTIVDVLRP